MERAREIGTEKREEALQMQESLDDIQEFNIDYNEDFRGKIYTTYHSSLNGLNFNHDKIAVRHKDVLVGIHGDNKTWKLISCLFGRIYCVFVDNRSTSEDYLKHKSLILNGNTPSQILLPPGIGNSFFVLSDVCVYNYKLSYSGEYQDVDQQFTLSWNDPKLNITWPHQNPILSERDR